MGFQQKCGSMRERGWWIGFGRFVMGCERGRSGSRNKGIMLVVEKGEGLRVKNIGG